MTAESEGEPNPSSQLRIFMHSGPTVLGAGTPLWEQDAFGYRYRSTGGLNAFIQHELLMLQFYFLLFMSLSFRFHFRV